jgi:hypothetical protein
MTLTLVLLTFVATTGLYTGLLLLAFRRVARHLQGCPEAVQAVTEHVLLPILGKQLNDADKKKLGTRDAWLC